MSTPAGKLTPNGPVPQALYQFVPMKRPPEDSDSEGGEAPITSSQKAKMAIPEVKVNVPSKKGVQLGQGLTCELFEWGFCVSGILPLYVPLDCFY